MRVFLYIFLIWLLFFIFIIFISNNLNFTFYPSIKLLNLGAFGDSFNILTSLFAGLAFASVIISIRLQKEELKEAKDIFKKQQEALEMQQAEMVIQSFDNKFFQMLNQFNIIKNNITIKEANIFINLRKKLAPKINTVNRVDIFQKIFIRFNDDNNDEMKYYFINLYQLLKFIDTSSSTSNKKYYTNIIRAQLSKDELVLLFYNAIGIIETNGEKYKTLVEKYAFFEHLKAKNLYIIDLNSNNHGISIAKSLFAEYNKSAFGNNQSLSDDLAKMN